METMGYYIIKTQNKQNKSEQDIFHPINQSPSQRLCWLDLNLYGEQYAITHDAQFLQGNLMASLLIRILWKVERKRSLSRDDIIVRK